MTTGKLQMEMRKTEWHNCRFLPFHMMLPCCGNVLRMARVWSFTPAKVRCNIGNVYDFSKCNYSMKNLIFYSQVQLINFDNSIERNEWTYYYIFFFEIENSKEEQRKIISIVRFLHFVGTKQVVERGGVEFLSIFISLLWFHSQLSGKLAIWLAFSTLLVELHIFMIALGDNQLQTHVNLLLDGWPVAGLTLSDSWRLHCSMQNDFH